MSAEAQQEVTGAISPYHIKLEVFEGPMDLLLHLIKENQMDIYNIQISIITEQYLKHLEILEELNLEIAGEFLVMAATLAHIKSKMLLPPEPNEEEPEEEGKDPREELVRRLLEYQKYKNAAEQLSAFPHLGRDVFTRELSTRNNALKDVPRELAEISVFKLIEAFHKVLKTLSLETPHQVSLETLSVRECVESIVTKIRKSKEGSVRFQDIFDRGTSRKRIVVSFLALLDLIRRGAIKIFQSDNFADIQLIGTTELYGEWKYDGTDEYENQLTQIDP